MNCDDAVTLLMRRQARPAAGPGAPPATNGDLDERETHDLDAHLACCDRCREAAAAQSEVAEVLSSRPERDVTPAFGARIAARIAQGNDWLGLADWKWLSVRLAPVAAVLLILAGIFMERQAQSSDNVSLSGVVETWATATSDRDRVPVTSVLWQSDANDDAALVTVLTAPPDATIARQADER